MSAEEAAGLSLMSAGAVRERARRMLALGLAGRLEGWHIDLSRLEAAAERVAALTRNTYPTLEVPLHARWRHFSIGGEDRWEKIDTAAPWRDRDSRARSAFDLAIISVLLDAGAGPRWRYRDPATGALLAGSEGLALASLALFADGALSSDPRTPLRVDAQALSSLSEETLARYFQVSATNPLLGVEGRLSLLRRLGGLVAARPDVFGRAGAARPGGLFDHLARHAPHGSIAACAVLVHVLKELEPIWPSRITLGGVRLGDCWRHPAMAAADPTSELVPLHKLSQWLTYSLLEPLNASGIATTDLDGLTGLAEYRNGGLLIDMGVLVLGDGAAAARSHAIDAPVVVAWRALTVALIDVLAERVRQKLGVDAARFPLAKVLQGGTWAAGRAIAREHRADGSPPLRVISDGTVF